MLGKDRVEVCWVKTAWKFPNRGRVESLLGALLMFQSSCPPPGGVPVSEGPPACGIKDYGRGVSYSNCASTFGPALADFRQYHEVVSISSFALSDAGTSGYWVIMKEKQ